jgi:hypothetical protein
MMRNIIINKILEEDPSVVEAYPVVIGLIQLNRDELKASQ